MRGVRTHGSLAILLGTAAYKRTRRAVLVEAFRLALGRGRYAESEEGLTPVTQDPPSAIPLALVATRTLLFPRSAEQIAHAAIRAYSISSEAIEELIAP